MNYSKVIIFISFLVIGSNLSSNKKASESQFEIKINVSKKNELAISQIGELIKIIPLQKVSSDNFLSTNRVIFDEERDYIFVSFGNFPLSVYQYKFSTGQLVRIINKDEVKLFDFPIRLLSYDNESKIGVIYKNIIYNYDYSGNLTDRYKMQNVGDIFYYNNKFWGFNVDFTGKGYDNYTLFSTDGFEKIDNNHEIIHKRNNECEPNVLKVKKDPFFNSFKGVLYFSHQADPRLYYLKNNKIKLMFEYSFNEADFSCPDLFSRKQKLFGDKWLLINYNFKGKKYSFLHQLKTNRSFNLEKGSIKDDLFGSEGILCRGIRIMKEDYFCFITQLNKLKPGLVNKSEESELCLVIMKAK